MEAVVKKWDMNDAIKLYHSCSKKKGGPVPEKTIELIMLAHNAAIEECIMKSPHVKNQQGIKSVLKLSDFDDSSIVAELKRRGWSGNLVQKRELIL